MPPSDLTTPAHRNGGAFPKDAVTAFVTVERARPVISAHGSAEMPVWGPIFRGLDRNEVANRQRVENIVTYIEARSLRSVVSKISASSRRSSVGD